MTADHRNLVIACVGDGSLHPEWLDRRDERNFDLFLVYYGDVEDQWRDHADHYARRKGAKYEILHSVCHEFEDILERYDTVWLPDDDIRTNTRNINRMFDLFTELHLQVGQPALDRQSFVNVSLTRQMPFVAARFTRCVEIMVPLFATPALRACKWTFGETKAAWGIDWIWVETVNGELEDTRKVAMLDATAVTHTRKQDLNAGFYSKLPVHPHEEMRQLLEPRGLMERTTDVRSFLCHEAAFRVFGRLWVLPMFPRVRFRLWQVYDAARRRFPVVGRIALRLRDLYLGRRGEPSIL